MAVLTSADTRWAGPWRQAMRPSKAKKAAVNTKVFTALNVAQAWTCDMLEKKEAEVAVEDNTVSLDFRAFEIKTLRLKLA